MYCFEFNFFESRNVSQIQTQKLTTANRNLFCVCEQRIFCFVFTQIHTNLVPSRHRFACFMYFLELYSRMLYTLVSIARRERQIFNTVIILRISVCVLCICLCQLYRVFVFLFAFINIYLVYFLLLFILLHHFTMPVCFFFLFAVSFC